MTMHRQRRTLREMVGAGANAEVDTSFLPVNQGGAPQAPEPNYVSKNEFTIQFCDDVVNVLFDGVHSRSPSVEYTEPHAARMMAEAYKDGGKNRELFAADETALRIRFYEQLMHNMAPYVDRGIEDMSNGKPRQPPDENQGKVYGYLSGYNWNQGERKVGSESSNTVWYVLAGIAGAAVIGTGAYYALRSKGAGKNPYAYGRARDIVRLASKKAKARSVKSWLFDDERGVWEREAKRMLEKYEPLANERGISSSQLDDEIATFLVIQALDATIAHEKKRAGKR